MYSKSWRIIIIINYLINSFIHSFIHSFIQVGTLKRTLKDSCVIEKDYKNIYIMNKDRSDFVLFTLIGATVGGIFLAQQCWFKKRRSRSGIGTKHPSALKSEYKGCIYLDYNATTPIFEEVADAMRPFTLSCFGNPSSPHVYARPCKEAVSVVARTHISDLLCL